MTSITIDNLGNDIKEPTFQVWIKSYVETRPKIFWQGESFILAIYKVLEAKTRGWWYVKLEWAE